MKKTICGFVLVSNLLSYAMDHFLIEKTLPKVSSANELALQTFRPTAKNCCESKWKNGCIGVARHSVALLLFTSFVGVAIYTENYRGLLPLTVVYGCAKATEYTFAKQSQRAVHWLWPSSQMAHAARADLYPEQYKKHYELCATIFDDYKKQNNTLSMQSKKSK